MIYIKINIYGSIIWSFVFKFFFYLFFFNVWEKKYAVCGWSVIELAGCSNLSSCLYWRLLRGDKVSMLTHANPWGRLKWPSAIIRLQGHFTCGLMHDLAICKHRIEYGHTWHWMLLPRPVVIKQHKTQTLTVCGLDLSTLASKARE